MSLTVSNSNVFNQAQTARMVKNPNANYMSPEMPNNKIDFTKLYGKNIIKALDNRRITHYEFSRLSKAEKNSLYAALNHEIDIKKGQCLNIDTGEIESNDNNLLDDLSYWLSPAHCPADEGYSVYKEKISQQREALYDKRRALFDIPTIRVLEAQLSKINKALKSCDYIMMDLESELTRLFEKCDENTINKNAMTIKKNMNDLQKNKEILYTQKKETAIELERVVTIIYESTAEERNSIKKENEELSKALSKNDPRKDEFRINCSNRVEYTPNCSDAMKYYNFTKGLGNSKYLKYRSW